MSPALEMLSRAERMLFEVGTINDAKEFVRLADFTADLAREVSS